MILENPPFSKEHDLIYLRIQYTQYNQLNCHQNMKKQADNSRILLYNINVRMEILDEIVQKVKQIDLLLSI